MSVMFPSVTLTEIQNALAMPAPSDVPIQDAMPDHVMISPKKVRPAAVLCPLFRHDAGLSILLTKRAAHLNAHAGQISFPGGKIDPSDACARAAALREADEEIGLAPAKIQILGSLSPYLTGTKFYIFPFIGLIHETFTPIPAPEEVAEVFEVPLDFVMNPANHQWHNAKVPSKRGGYFAIPYQDKYIWGATAGILRGLALRIQALRESNRYEDTVDA